MQPSRSPGGAAVPPADRHIRRCSLRRPTAPSPRFPCAESSRKGSTARKLYRPTFSPPITLSNRQAAAARVDPMKRRNGRQRIAQQPPVDGDPFVLSRAVGKRLVVRCVNHRVSLAAEAAAHNRRRADGGLTTGRRRASRQSSRAGARSSVQRINLDRLGAADRIRVTL